MRKSTVVFAGCAVLAWMLCGVQAKAAQPSAQKLSQMGLGGAQIVSDSAAMNVRGFGYSGGSRSRIWGKAIIEVGGLRRIDRYNSTATGSQSDSSFVAVPLGGDLFLFSGGSSSEGTLKSIERPGTSIAFDRGGSALRVSQSGSRTGRKVDATTLLSATGSVFVRGSMWAIDGAA